MGCRYNFHGCHGGICSLVVLDDFVACVCLAALGDLMDSRGLVVLEGLMVFDGLIVVKVIGAILEGLDFLSCFVDLVGLMIGTTV